MSVWITGLGVVAPNGLGVDDYWSTTLKSEHGISRITRFDPSAYPAVLAGQVLDFDPAEHLPARLLPQTDLSTRFALAGAAWSLADAAIDPAEVPEYNMGVITSNATGGFEFTHREFHKLWAKGPEFVSVYESFAWFYAVNTGQISIRHGMRGPGRVLLAEQAGGLDAIGQARRTVLDGTPVVVTGGVDSSLDPWGWASHLSSGRVSRCTDPTRAYRPFAADAEGYVPGEGGALLVVEDSDTARRTTRYGEIAGYAATFDPKPGSSRPPALRRAAELALADAGIRPRDVDVVFADAVGVADLDAIEAAAIRDLFGPGGVAVTAPKTLTGRLYSGGGPLDVATALLSIRHDVIPPTAHTAAAEHHEIDLVTGLPRYRPVDTAIVLARGKWGFNSALVVRGTAR